jgi:hypothetical protein
MHMPPNCRHAMQPSTGHAHTPNTLGKFPDENRPAGFDDQFKKNLQDWHPGIVALFEDRVKKGKPGYAAGWSDER